MELEELLDGKMPGARYPSCIDWEQRRYELAKHALGCIGLTDKNKTYKDIVISSLGIADALIEELKKDIPYEGDNNYIPLNSHYAYNEAPDGIYVATLNGNCWRAEYSALVKDIAIGIAIVSDEYRFIVSKKGSDEPLPLLDNNKIADLKIYSPWRETLKIPDGYANTESLLELGSPAAEYCKKQGGQWYIPSIGQWILMDKYGDDLNHMMPLIGGEPIPKELHYSSTKGSVDHFYYINWRDGSILSIYQGKKCYIRPVSYSITPPLIQL